MIFFCGVSPFNRSLYQGSIFAPTGNLLGVDDIQALHSSIVPAQVFQLHGPLYCTTLKHPVVDE